MPFVERSDGSFFKICRDEVGFYPEYQIRTAEEIQQKLAQLKKSETTQPPVNLPNFEPIKAAVLQPSQLQPLYAASFSRIEGMDSM